MSDETPAASRFAKQVIVMRKGKMIAQGAHASLKVLLDLATRTETAVNIPTHGAVAAWLTGRFTKVCVSVDSEAELNNVVARTVGQRARRAHYRRGRDSSPLVPAK